MRYLLVALLLAGCAAEPEDLGARLRRDCITVIRETQPDIREDSLREAFIRNCIEVRSRR